MPHATIQELETLVDELATGREPAPTRLALLSDLTPDEASVIRKSWERIPAPARESLLDETTDLAEGDVTLEFRQLALIGLDDPEAAVRLSAIAALWESRERDVAIRLASLLSNDPEEAVRAAAGGALGEFVVAYELGGLDEATGETIVSALRQAFGDGAEPVNVRAAAVESLGARSEPWVETLIADAYYHDDRVLRIAAVRAMGDSANTRWLDLLQEDLDSGDPDLRYEAVAAVGEIGGQEGLDLVIPLLEDDDRQMVVAAVRAIGAIGGEGSIEVLEDFRRDLEDPDLVAEVESAIDIARFGEEGELGEWDE